MPKKLTARMQVFVDNIIAAAANGMTNGECYQAAYPNCKNIDTASKAANKLLKDPRIDYAISKARRKISRATHVTVERVLLEDARIALADPGELLHGFTPIPISDLPEDTRRAVSSVKVRQTPMPCGEIVTEYEYKFWPKGPAIDRLNRHLGNYERDNKQKNEGLDNLADILNAAAAKEAEIEASIGAPVEGAS